MYRGCLNRLNGMKLGNNSRMTFSKDIFHSVGIDGLSDLVVMPSN
jgi:hypothetical protein